MILYVAIWNDRHTDTTAHVFSDAEQAVAWAQEKAREYDRYGDLDEELLDGMRASGWLYYGRYSEEGDEIHVVTCELDKELK